MKSSLGQTVTASSVSHSYLVEQIWKKRADGVKDWTMRGTKGPKARGTRRTRIYFWSEINAFLILKISSFWCSCCQATTLAAVAHMWNSPDHCYEISEMSIPLWCLGGGGSSIQPIAYSLNSIWYFAVINYEILAQIRKFTLQETASMIRRA